MSSECRICLQSLVLTARADFLLDHGHTQTDTQSQTPLLTLPQYRLPLAWGNDNSGHYCFTELVNARRRGHRRRKHTKSWRASHVRCLRVGE